jgi:hypothetical protein
VKAKFARFVVREDAGLMLGKSFNGLLKPDRVYQITEILGELTIKDMGPTAMGTRSDGIGVSWNHTANDIVQNGHHLHTREEYKILCDQGRKS